MLKYSIVFLTLILYVLLAALPVAGASAKEPSCDPSLAAITYRPGGPAIRQEGGDQLIPCVYRTGASSMEPTFAFARSGAILFQAWTTRQDTRGGVPPVSSVIRSRDGGRTWTDITPRLGAFQTHATSLDPYLIVDPRTGRFFTVDYAGAGSPVCATISSSDDEGDHWSTSPLACGGFDGESIAAGPPVSSEPIGFSDLVYYCTGTTLGSSPPATSPACSKSFDGGRTFTLTGSPPFPPADEEAQGDVYGPWAGNPVVAGDGTLYVPKRHGGQPRLAISRNEGLTWDEVTIARSGSAGQANRVAVDARGNVYYTWIAGDHLPYLAVSHDRGRSFGAPMRISPPGVREASIPRVEVERPGRAAVIYLGTVNGPGRPPWAAPCNVHLSECDDGRHAASRWNGYMTLVEGALGPRPLLRTATVKRERSPLFTGACAAEGQCKAMLDFGDVHFDRRGRVWAAFVDDCALQRRFIPVFNVHAPRCADGVGEGILAQLRPVSAPGPGCLAHRSPIGPRNIGRVRLGRTRRRQLRIRVAPRRRTQRTFRYCVKSSRGRVIAVFSSRRSSGRIRLVATTAGTHRMRAVGGGAPLSRLRARFPSRRRISRTLYLAGPRSRRLFGVRRGRVRFVAVADARLLRDPPRLRGYLRLAGL